MPPCNTFLEIINENKIKSSSRAYEICVGHAAGINKELKSNKIVKAILKKNMRSKRDPIISIIKKLVLGQFIKSDNCAKTPERFPKGKKINNKRKRDKNENLNYHLNERKKRIECMRKLCEYQFDEWSRTKSNNN
tara:strand:- start:228 stop:632 length:405 start_codon:yes stop_codon:yes gene_type:complete